MKNTKAQGGIGITGHVRIRVVGPDGGIKHDITKKNLVVDAGLTLLANRISSAVPDSECLVNYLAVGTGTNAPDANDTELQIENARKAVTSRTHDGPVAAISTVFDAGDVPTSTLKEVGAFIDGTGVADSGTLFARQNIDVPVTALDAVFIDWRFTFSDA